MTHHLKAILNSVFFDNLFIRFIPGCRNGFFVCHTRQQFHQPNLWETTMMLKFIAGKMKSLVSGKIHWYENTYNIIFSIGL